MPRSSPLTRTLSALQAHCQGPVLAQAEECARFARDFGGMVERTPAVVVQPVSDFDVALALRVAVEHGVAVSTRGRAHSQSGQGLGRELLIDMSQFRRVLRVDADRGLVEAEAGASWRDVLASVFERGLMPVGLTHALDTTLAGTLSVGGMRRIASHRSSGRQRRVLRRRDAR